MPDAARRNPGDTERAGSVTRMHPYDKALLDARPVAGWILADQALVKAIAERRPVAHGRRGGRLAWLMRLFSGTGLDFILLALVGGLAAIRIWVTVGSPGPENSIRPVHFMLGHGGGSERSLWNSFREQRGQTAVLLEIGRPESWRELGRPRLGSMLGGLGRALRDVRAAQKCIGATLPRGDLLTSCAKVIGWYAYTFEAWKLVRPRAADLVSLAPDVATCAAIDADIPTTYQQHGLVGRSVHIPRVREILALSREEAEHFRRRQPGVPVRRRQSGANLETVNRSVAVIASIYGPPRDRMLLIEDFIGWAVGRRIDVIVRLHPRESGSFWKSVPRRFHLLGSDEPMDAFLDRVRPWCLVSWYSTSLFEALDRGVLPITVSPADTAVFDDLVYPIRFRSLCWPEQRSLVEEAHRSEVARRELVSSLRGDR